jgi:PIN domain
MRAEGKVLTLLIDTCVWLDVAKDHRQEVTLRYLEELIETGEVGLLLPRQVLDEFARNRDRIIKENQQSLSAVFKRVKETVGRFGDETHRAQTLAQLNEVDHRIATLSEAVVGSIEMIEGLFRRAIVMDPSDRVKVRAADRALAKRAPFHRNKNSIGDAILLEASPSRSRAQSTGASTPRVAAVGTARVSCSSPSFSPIDQNGDICCPAQPLKHKSADKILPVFWPELEDIVP